MSPGFRLAGLLRLRRSQQDQAAVELASAAHARMLASQAARRQRDALGSHRTPASCTSTAWTASVAARAALTTASGEAAVLELRAEDAGEAAGARWRDARQRTRALEHLEAQHSQRVRTQLLRAEQLRIDEHTAATRRGGTEGSAT